MQETIEQRAERLVRQEVLCCVSHVVATLAGGWGTPRVPINEASQALESLCEQAFELASPVLDYEEAAHQEGWSLIRVESDRAMVFQHTDGRENYNTTWGELCDEQGINPYEWEVFEHWAVSDYLADLLIEAGEKVDKDFANLCVWARTTTGQGIAMDSCIRRAIEISDKRIAELLAS